MGWFFQTRSPVDEEARWWVDRRMNWLAGEFGLDCWWASQAVEPTDTFFPDRYDGSEYAIEKMCLRICEYMEVDPDRVALRLYSEDESLDVGGGMRTRQDRSKGSAGHYSVEHKEIISIESTNISDPATVAATIAHELSHVRLLGEGRVNGDEEDHEQLTDLATVFFGMGIFNANQTIRYQQSGSAWQTGMLGYLDEKTFGYALGVWAYVRGEESPGWMRHLRPSVKKIMKKSMRFLFVDEKNIWRRRRKKCK